MDDLGDLADVGDLDAGLPAVAEGDAPDPFDGDDVPAAAESAVGSTISYPDLENPDSGNSVEWSSDSGWTDAGTDEPVDSWKTESTS
jgi:hypothetical protein